jgi:hypothetical protein
MERVGLSSLTCCCEPVHRTLSLGLNLGQSSVAHILVERLYTQFHITFPSILRSSKCSSSVFTFSDQNSACISYLLSASTETASQSNCNVSKGAAASMFRVEVIVDLGVMTPCSVACEQAGRQSGSHLPPAYAKRRSVGASMRAAGYGLPRLACSLPPSTCFRARRGNKTSSNY